MQKLLFIGMTLPIIAFTTPFLLANVSKTQAETVVVPTIFPTVTLMPSATPTPTLIPTPTVDYQRVQQKAVLQTRLEYVNFKISNLQKAVDFNDTVNKQIEAQFQDQMKNGLNGSVVNVSQSYGEFVNAEMQDQVVKNQLNDLIEQRKEIEAELAQL